MAVGLRPILNQQEKCSLGRSDEEEPFNVFVDEGCEHFKVKDTDLGYIKSSDANFIVVDGATEYPSHDGLFYGEEF